MSVDREAQAKDKFCPIFVAGHFAQPLDRISEDGYRNFQKLLMCKGGACMLWTWTEGKYARATVYSSSKMSENEDGTRTNSENHITRPLLEGERRGKCGLVPGHDSQ